MNLPKTGPDEWFTVEEAAHYAKRSVSLMNKMRRPDWAWAPGPKYSKTGGRVLYRRSWIDTWLLNGGDGSPHRPRRRRRKA